MRVSLATTVLPGLDHIGPLERSQTEVTVVRRAEDLAELLAAARSGLVDAVLVAGGTESLTRAFLDEVTRAPRPVGVLAISDVRGERRRLRGLGVPCLPADVEPQALARAVQDVARSALLGQAPDLGPVEADDDVAALESLWSEAPAVEFGPAGSGAADAAGVSGAWAHPPDDARPGDPVDAGAERDGPDEDGGSGDHRSEAPSGWTREPEERVEESQTRPPGPEDPAVADGADVADGAPEPRTPGRVVVVWGPTGAPGRTTVAVNLAAELALAGHRTLVVDLDTYGPSVGVHLGLTEESAGIARAARRAERDRVAVTDLIDAAVRLRVGGAALDVLTGLTRTDRWPELRASAVEQVLAAAREGWERVVVDVAFNLEEDEDLSFDVPAPQRNAATLAAVGVADKVLAVGAADAVSLPRLIRGVEALTAAAPAAAVQVVVNRVRVGASGVSPQAQVTAVWERFGPAVAVSACLPWDPAAADRALLGGQVLAEAAPKSPLRRAVRTLAEEDGGPSPAGAARPRRRLAPWSALSRRTR